MRRKLLANPATRGDLEVMAWIASGASGEEAASLRLAFLDRYGLAVARDRRSPMPWLMILVNAISGTGNKRYPDVAGALARNPELMSSRQRAAHLTYDLYLYPQAMQVACASYHRRYGPNLHTWLDSAGRQVQQSANCPEQSD
jgi:hypothetical protein